MTDTNLLIKLFDTLKESSKDTQQLCQALLNNQTKIGGLMKNLPIEELRDALKDHAKESAADIDSCSETVETTSDKILEEVKKIGAKVNKMILVVGVAFTVVTAGYFLIRHAADSRDEYDHVEIERKQEKAIDEKLNRFMNEIRDEMNKLKAKDIEVKSNEPIHK